MTLSIDMAVRSAFLARLRADALLATLVETIDDGEGPLHTVSAVTLGSITGDDWGAKDREGAELRVAVTVNDRSDEPEAVGRAARRVAELFNGWPAAGDAVADQWRVVAARVVRTRTVRTRDGATSALIDARLRCWTD